MDRIYGQISKGDIILVNKKFQNTTEVSRDKIMAFLAFQIKAEELMYNV